jgi:hypothetical protein
MATSASDEMVQEENEDSYEEGEMSDGEYESTSTTVVSRALRIKQLKAQLKKLQNEHRREADEASMFLDAQKQYKRWDNGQPLWGLQGDRKPSRVLLALKSENVPQCMMWSYPHGFYNYKLDNNREVFLARIELDDFESAFDDKRLCPIPKRFRSDKEVLMLVCSKVSDALQYATNKLKVRTYRSRSLLSHPRISL